MNTAEEYRQLIKNILINCIEIPQEYKKKENPSYRNFINHNSYSQIEFQLIISENFNDYLVIVYGYNIPQSTGINEWNVKRIKDCVVHIEINDGIIKVHQDKLKDSITNELIEAGISQDKIVRINKAKQECVEYVVNQKKIYELNQNYFTTDSNFKNIILKPNLTSAQLIKLSAIDLECFNKEIAQHPKTPPDLLQKLFEYFPKEVLNNPVIDLLILENPKFIEQLFNNHRSTFCNHNLELPDYFIKWAVNNEHENIRVLVANNKNLPLFWLEKLLSDRDCAVIQSLFKNPSLPVNIKEKLNEQRIELEKICSKKINDGCTNNNCPLEIYEFTF